MRLLQGFHSGRAAYIDVGIVDAAALRDYKINNKPLLRGVHRYRALLDTGATSTMLTTKVISDLSLRPVGKKEYHDLKGRSWRKTYLFNVCFYDDEQVNDDDMTRPDPVVTKTFVGNTIINGAEIDSSPSFDVLLGMDVITTGDLHISQDGTFRFSF